MNAHFTKTFEARLAPLVHRIEQLEQVDGVASINAIEWHSAEIDDIFSQLNTLASLARKAGRVFYRNVEPQLQRLATRLQFLPGIPRIEVVRLAQNVLALNPIILVTDDAINEASKRPVLTRLCLMEPTGEVRFDYQVPDPLHPHPDGMEEVSPGDTLAAQPVPESLKVAWAEFQAMTHGRFVVAFDLFLCQIQLEITAQDYRLPIPMLIGHSVLDLLLQYTKIKAPLSQLGELASAVKDATLCDLLAEEDVQPLVDVSSAPADQRALRLLQTLQAAANGTLVLQEPERVSLLDLIASDNEEKGT